jgi:hypothetical protein
MSLAELPSLAAGDSFIGGSPATRPSEMFHVSGHPPARAPARPPPLPPPHKGALCAGSTVGVTP